jgi:hypothetical protein
VHLGKSSVGWRFSIQTHKAHYSNFKEFVAFINRKDLIIATEYGEEITAKELLALIKSKKDELHHEDCDFPAIEYKKEEYADLTCREFS